MLACFLPECCWHVHLESHPPNGQEENCKHWDTFNNYDEGDLRPANQKRMYGLLNMQMSDNQAICTGPVPDALWAGLSR